MEEKIKVRSSNFELLRIVLICGVMFMHFNTLSGMWSYMNPGTATYYISHFGEVMCVCSVDVFILISGYFSSGKTYQTFRRPLGIILTVVAYSALSYIATVLLGVRGFSAYEFVTMLVPQNWYVTLYVALMLIAPYINIVINRLNRKQFNTLIAVSFTVFCLWNSFVTISTDIIGVETEGTWTIGVSGDNSGYTIVNFVILYIIGTWIKRENISLKLHWDIIGYFACIIIMFFGGFISTKFWAYNCPFTMLSGFFLFDAFSKLKIQSAFINRISKTTLGIYIISTSEFVIRWFWQLFRPDLVNEWTAGGYLLRHILCVVASFILCAAIDMLFTWAVKPIGKLLDKIPFLMKKYISVEE